ncbi:FTR1 family protein [Azonexus sp.]|jgi:high-affinity iron transporter|uniref:FTR1 family iron permease n=1 Tax=Azonexus sp. TaxID=1872668 RepID=UPI0028177214|nr:FTR1 family protein [Azonexus sp.]MDR1994737.1 FTR1 family protein [Azonexus sp.]
MTNAFFVVWRESLEAFLIAGILFAWLKANDDSGRGRRALFTGLGAGVLLALALGWALLTVQDELTGQALEIFQTATLLVAAGLITQMVLWMHRHGRRMKARLHAELSTAAERSGYLGVAVVAALAVAREGAETVIFLYGLAQGSDLLPLIVGSTAGFVGAAATAWLAAKSLTRLNLGLLLRLSSILLLVLASSLLIAASDRLIGTDWLPALIDPVWDSSALLDDGTTGGKLLADFTGYRARPALTTLLVWLGYWALVFFGIRRAQHA